MRKESYRLENVVQKMPDRIKVWKKYIKDEGGTTSVDLVKFVKDQLIEVCVINENIIDSGIDTAKDKRFFFHYRDSRSEKGDQGRFATVVGLR